MLGRVGGCFFALWFDWFGGVLGELVLPDQGAYPTQGRLLVFNGRRGGKSVL